MTILEIWLSVICVFLWISGGSLLYATGVMMGKCGHGKSPKWLIITIWPFAALYVMLTEGY